MGGMRWVGGWVGGWVGRQGRRGGGGEGATASFGLCTGVACDKQLPGGREPQQCSFNIIHSHPHIPLALALAAAENLLIYGWRIPFLLAFGTAMLGFVLRRGMPEPKAFLAAARAEKEAAARANGDAEAPAALEASATGSKR